MLKILLLLIICNFSFCMEPPMQRPARVPTLKYLCMERIVKEIQKNPHYNTAHLAQLPIEIAEPFLKVIEDNIDSSRCIAQLPGQGKLSPDGSKVLVDENHADLKVYDTKTGTFLYSLEDSLTSDGKRWTHDNGRFIPINWSSVGRYIYANYSMPNSAEGEFRYLYKIWNSTTGTKLYEFPCAPCWKLYFSANDAWLLSKKINKPLKVYHSATGVYAATLGDPTYPHKKTPQDRLGQWLVVKNVETTQFHEIQSLALIKTLAGSPHHFSKDGTFILRTNEWTGQIREHDAFDMALLGPPARERVTIPYACIYNRMFQLLAKIAISGWGYRLAMDPSSQILIDPDDRERHYSIGTGEKIDEFEHETDFDCYPIATFAHPNSIDRIRLQKDGNKTLITTTGDVKLTIKCPQQVNRIFYTVYPHIVVLAQYRYMHYFLNLKTGTLIPYAIALKQKMFSYKPTKNLCPQGYFVAKKDDQFELRQLQTTGADSLIAVLQKKLDQP